MNHLANLFRKEVAHSERVKNPNRTVKKVRQSDVHIGKDQVSMKQFITQSRKHNKGNETRLVENNNKRKGM